MEYSLEYFKDLMQEESFLLTFLSLENHHLSSLPPIISQSQLLILPILLLSR
jgi:hypothetical protein